MDDEETRSDMIMEDDVLDDENDIQCTNGSRGNQYDSPSDNDTANSEATTELAMSSILSFIDSATSFDDSRNSLTATDILDSVAAETAEHLFARLRRREISQIRICCEDQRRINTIQEKLRHVNTRGRKEWRLASGCIRTWSYEKLKDKLHKAEEDAIDSVEASIEHLIHITGQRMRVELVLKSLYETRGEYRIKLTELAIETRDRFVGDEREYSIKNTTPRTKSVYFVLSKRALDSQTEVEDAFEDLLPRLFPKEVARL